MNHSTAHGRRHSLPPSLVAALEKWEFDQVASPARQHEVLVELLLGDCVPGERRSRNWSTSIGGQAQGAEMNVAGVVILEITVGVDGSITNPRVLRSARF